MLQLVISFFFVSSIDAWTKSDIHNSGMLQLNCVAKSILNESMLYHQTFKWMQQNFVSSCRLTTNKQCCKRSKDVRGTRCYCNRLSKKLLQTQPKWLRGTSTIHTSIDNVTKIHLAKKEPI